MLPAGYTLREFVPGRDQRAAFEVIDTAFGEWPDAERGTFEDWAAETLGRPGFAPSQVGTVVRGEKIVGVAVLIEDPGTIWVSQLAVARAHRGRGLARAVVLRAIEASRLAQHELTFLVADEDDWPRRLYERLGFETIGRVHYFAKAPVKN